MTKKETRQAEVYVKFQLEGFHCWPEAAEVFPEVRFLSSRHRHLFHFKCYAKVTHSDRDIEFILLKRHLEKQLRHKFSLIDETGVPGLEFDRMSCEDIANWILDNNESVYKVDVSEDGENGAIVERTNHEE